MTQCIKELSIMRDNVIDNNQPCFAKNERAIDNTENEGVIDHSELAAIM